MTFPTTNCFRRCWKTIIGTLGLGGIIIVISLGIIFYHRMTDATNSRPIFHTGSATMNRADSSAKKQAPATTAKDEPNQLLSRYTLPVKTLVFSLDGRRLVTAADVPSNRDGFRIWDLISGREELHNPTIRGNVFALALSSDGKTLVSSGWGGFSRPGDNTSETSDIKIWNFDEDSKPALLQKMDQRCIAVAFSPQGDRVAVGGRPGSLTMYNRETKTPEVSLPTDSLRIDSGSTSFSNLAFSADGKKIAWGGLIVPNSPNPGPNPYPPSVVQVWDALSGKPSITLRPPKSPDASSYVNGIAFLPDSDTLIASCGSKIYFWNLRSGEIEATLDGHRGGIIGALALSRDGKVLASSDSYACIKLWDVSTRREKATLRQPTIYVQGLSKPGMQQNQTRALAFDPDGEILASSTIYWETVDEKHSAQKGFVQLWDVATAKEIALPR